MNKSISQIAEDLCITRQTIYNKLKDAALSAAVKAHTVQQGKYTLYNEQAQELIKQAICGNSVNDDLTACKKEFDKVSNDLTECKNELDKLSKELENRDNNILELNAEIDDLKAENETVKDDLTKCKDLLSDRDNTIADLRRQLSERDKTIEELTAQLSDTEKKLDEYKHKVSALTEFNNLHHKTIDRLEKENNKLNERLDKAETERAGFLNNISELTIALKAAQALHGMDKQQAVIELKEPAEQATQDQSEPPRKTSLFSKLFRRK